MILDSGTYMFCHYDIRCCRLCHLLRIGAVKTTYQYKTLTDFVIELNDKNVFRDQLLSISGIKVPM
jgi:hypothetical protein